MKREKPESQEAPTRESAKYELTVTFTEPMLASSPMDPEVYATFIASKKPATTESLDEAETIDAAEKREVTGWSVFHKDGTGLFLFDYKVRGFLKEAWSAISGKDGLSAGKSKIDKWVFVQERRIYLHNPDGTAISQPHGVNERPIRAMTMQGPRTSLKRSDYVNAGVTFTCHLLVLPLGVNIITEGLLRKWLDYGQFMGMGEWRTGSNGRFSYTLAKQ